MRYFPIILILFIVGCDPDTPCPEPEVIIKYDTIEKPVIEIVHDTAYIVDNKAIDSLIQQNNKQATEYASKIESLLDTLKTLNKILSENTLIKYNDTLIVKIDEVYIDSGTLEPVIIIKR